MMDDIEGNEKNTPTSFMMPVVVIVSNVLVIDFMPSIKFFPDLHWSLKKAKTEMTGKTKFSFQNLC